MQGLIAAEASLASGGTLVFHQVGGPDGDNDLTGNQSGWGAAQWQAVRFGFAAAMQRNWHYALSCGQGDYGSLGLMDEQVQTVNGKANYGWLSAGTQRLDPPQSAAWSNGVWRRRFPDGWVLWNPRGNGAQTVTIPSTLCRIKTRGYGNSRGEQRSVWRYQCDLAGRRRTVPDRDGLRSTSRSMRAAAPPGIARASPALAHLRGGGATHTALMRNSVSVPNVATRRDLLAVVHQWIAVTVPSGPSVQCSRRYIVVGTETVCSPLRADSTAPH